MPNLPETFVAFFAILKLGAIVMPLFSGFGPSPIQSRLNHGGAKAVITADGTWRRGVPAPLKSVLDVALDARHGAPCHGGRARRPCDRNADARRTRPLVARPHCRP